MQFQKNEKGYAVTSDSGHEYQVYLIEGKATFCTCPGSKFAKIGSRICKHCLAVEAHVSGASKPVKVKIAERNRRWMASVGSEPVTKVADIFAAKWEGAQLAEKFDGKALGKPHTIEPKMDGFRGLAFVNGDDVRILSRSGKPFYNYEAVATDLRALNLSEAVLDGELLVSESWDQTASVVRTEMAHPKAKDLIFIVFDVLTWEEWKAGSSKAAQWQRRKVLEDLIDRKASSDRLGWPVKGGKHVRLVPSYPVSTAAQVVEKAREFAADGFEGAMLKDPDAIYARKRSGNWRKVKFVQDFDCMIVGAEEGKGKFKGTLGALVMDCGKGVISNVGTGFDDAERDHLWAMHLRGELIGKTAEVLVQEITKDGHFRFPVYARLREDK